MIPFRNRVTAHEQNMFGGSKPGKAPKPFTKVNIAALVLANSPWAG
jgi:hypothetical protein